ncbi:hypothetical protein BJX63DRAFT_413393 [Aspergillus granulosus]|uniref:Uncharacterized protein n=1 Tax=Aspergillus granulosus TaxID=176169 RepID=A0ABR4GVD3_9EURO
MSFFPKPRYPLISPNLLEKDLKPMKVACFERACCGHRRLLCIPSESSGKVNSCLAASICDKLRAERDFTWLVMLVGTVFNLCHGLLWRGESTGLRITSFALGFGGCIYAYLNSIFHIASPTELTFSDHIWSRWCWSPRFRTISRNVTNQQTMEPIRALQIMVIILYTLELSFPAYIVFQRLNSQLGFTWTESRAILYTTLIQIVLMAHLAQISSVKVLCIAKDFENKDGQPFGAATAQYMLRIRLEAIHQWLLESIPDYTWNTLEVGEVDFLPVESFVEQDHQGYAGVDFGLMGLLQLNRDDVTLCLSDGAPLDHDVVNEALLEGFHEVEHDSDIILGRTICGKKMAEKYGANPRNWHGLSVDLSRWTILARQARKLYAMRN